MSPATNTFAPHASPLIRSRLYKLLSLGFRYPDPGSFEILQSGEFMAAVRDCLSAVPHLKSLADDGAGLTGTLKGGTLLDLEVGFNQTFEVGAPEPPCPPYEGLFRPGESRTSLMMEIAEFYRHFGLQANRAEGRSELPDHICSELEFLHFLAYKEAQAGNDDAELLTGYILAQKDFLERHPLKWLAAFAARLRECSAIPFYTALGRITAEFVSRDHAHAAEQLEAAAGPQNRTCPAPAGFAQAPGYLRT